MKKKIIIDFNIHIGGKSIKNLELEDLAFIPRVGDWFNVVPLIKDEEIREWLTEKSYQDGVLYVREIWHTFQQEGYFFTQIIQLNLAFTDDDDWWLKRFK
jgi:hypothetical protein